VGIKITRIQYLETPRVRAGLFAALGITIAYPVLKINEK